MLRGEESKRVFDYRVVVTNANALSEIEKAKRQEMTGRLQELVQDSQLAEDQFGIELDRLNDYMQYSWQDMREIRANQLLNHYSKEQEFDQIFNEGFCDAYIVGEEIYQCDIVGGEPVLQKLDPRKVRVLGLGYSNRIEDADMVIIEDYVSPGRVIDAYWDSLSPKDIKAIEEAPNTMTQGYADSMDNIDERYGIADGMFLDSGTGTYYGSIFDEGISSLAPYDYHGNIRVMKVYWKSRRKIKKVKRYNVDTGEEEYEFYPEDYVTDKDMGEEEQSFWINQAWEGVKIGSDIYVNMRPRPVQYNVLSNPSKCHFGIVGSIYNINGQKPYSLIDMVKPYTYLYDIIHDRLNRLLARNVGKVIRLDFAKMPDKWKADQWMYFIHAHGIAVEDSFKEGDYGAATGKLAGALNNASSGVVDAGLGQDISSYISLLDYIDNKTGQMLGISRQREGQIDNRETVGGVERATLQSSHITEWLFFRHDSVKRRVCECFIETAKIAL